jgi:hypothetical protein
MLAPELFDPQAEILGLDFLDPQHLVEMDFDPGMLRWMVNEIRGVLGANDERRKIKERLESLEREKKRDAEEMERRLQEEEKINAMVGGNGAVGSNGDQVTQQQQVKIIKTCNLCCRHIEICTC